MEMLSDATLAYGEEMVAALLGVDQLITLEGGEEDDRLVVVNMAPTHQPERFETIEAATLYVERLRRRAGELPEMDRRLYYDQLCASTIALMRWRQGRLSFIEQIEAFLHVPPAPASDAELDDLRGEMRRVLNALGYVGDLAAQCHAWEERNRVPPDEVPGVLQSFMDEAWERTAARMEMPATRADGMRVSVVSGVPFNARCDYLRRSVELNTDPVLTYQGLKHLAVHECYPGHYVQFKLRETWYRDGTAAADGLLSIVNSASSCTFEGIADNGLRVVDWITSDDDRLSALMSRYRSGLGTGAAWRLHSLGWPEGQVRSWLVARTLVGGEGWVENRLRFIRAPQRAALIWSYWWGERLVAPVWLRQPTERRPAFLRYLYGRMHSPHTVALFDAPAAEGGR